ncbi:MAG: MATE family efflux transporter [Muribaculaceae bacterium]|nr:MATE family efflux transporter [Muribaculaceae bacterium]
MSTSANSVSNLERLRELSTMSVGRLLWKYSLPAVAGMVIMQAYNVVDRIFIGQVVGKEAIAGLAITFPVMNIATALGTLVGAGAAARVSLFLGASDEDSARKVLGNALTLTIAIGMVYISLFAWGMDTVLEWFGANEQTLPYARDFMMFILPGLFLTNLTFSFNNIMRASGYPIRAMLTMFIGAGLNILLAPVFIYFLDLGIKGAAIATDIAMTVSMVFVMQHFFRSANGPVTFRRGIYRLEKGIVWGMLGIGAAPFIINVASCMINIQLNHALLRYGGVDAIAASGIFVTFTAMLCCVVLGICQGMQPIVGYNYGAGDAARVRRAFWLAVGAGSVITFIGWAVGMTVPEYVARAFVADWDLANFTGHALRSSMLFFWVVGFQIVSTTYFQSTGKIGLSIFLSLIRQVIFFIPLLLWLPRLMGIDGVWSAFYISDIFSTTVTVILIWIAMRELRKLAPATKNESLNTI